MPDKATRFPVGLKFFVLVGRNGFFGCKSFISNGVRQDRGRYGVHRLSGYELAGVGHDPIVRLFGGIVSNGKWFVCLGMGALGVDRFSRKAFDGVCGAAKPAEVDSGSIRGFAGAKQVAEKVGEGWVNFPFGTDRAHA